MIGKFDISPELMKVEETMENHESIAFITISTTGIDAKNKKMGFVNHEPVRATVVEYKYDEKEQRYIKNLVFDEYVKCDKKAIAETAKNGYKVLLDNGIDWNEYLKGSVGGKVVLEQLEFDRRLANFISSINDDEVIFSNSCSFVIEYLSKTAPSAVHQLDRFAKNHAFLDVRDVANKVYGVYNMSLKDMNEKLNGAGSVIGKGTMPKIEVMSNFIQKVGRDNGFLSSVIQENFNEAYAEERELLSQKGREQYRESDLDSKIAFWKDKGIVDFDSITQRDGKCDLNKLFDIFDGKTKGFSVMQAATTGFTAGNEIIQFTLYSYEVLPDGSFKSYKGISKDIMASKHSIMEAKQVAQTSRFDAFKYAGIDINKYEEGVGLLTTDMLMQRISKFFQICPTSDYPIITLGKTTDGRYGFTQGVLMKNGNIKALYDPYIDFSQVLKEYFYLVETDTKLKTNAIVPKEKVDEIKSFGLEEILKANGVDDVTGTKKKCKNIVKVMKVLSEQYRKEYVKDTPLKNESDKSEQIKDNVGQEASVEEKSEDILVEAAVAEETVVSENRDDLNAILERFKAEKKRELENQTYVETDVADFKPDAEKAFQIIEDGEDIQESPEIDDRYKSFFFEEDPIAAFYGDSNEYADDSDYYDSSSEVIIGDTEEEYEPEAEIEAANREVVSEEAEEGFDLFANLQNADRSFDEPEAEETEDMPAAAPDSLNDSTEHEDKTANDNLEQPAENTEVYSSELFGMVSELSSVVEVLSQKMDAMSGNLSEIQKGIEEISLKQSENEQKIETMSSTISQIAEVDKGIVKALMNHEQHNSDIRKNIELLENSTNSIKDEQIRASEQIGLLLDMFEKGKKAQRQQNGKTDNS